MTSKYQVSFTGTVDRLDKIIRETENPRHKAILLNYRQHGLLEVSGRYEEFMTPELMVEDPVYYMAIVPSVVLRGIDEIRAFYQQMCDDRALVIWPVEQILAVADWGFSGEAQFNQFVPGKVLAAEGEDIDDPDAIYLVSLTLAQVWRYDDRVRLIGESVFADASRRVVTKPDPADVITIEDARRLYAPYLANPPA
jgi:hypothetical protein